MFEYSLKYIFVYEMHSIEDSIERNVPSHAQTQICHMANFSSSSHFMRNNPKQNREKKTISHNFLHVYQNMK